MRNVFGEDFASRREVNAPARPPRTLLRWLLLCLAFAACLLFVSQERARLALSNQQCVADSRDAARLLKIGERGHADATRARAPAPAEIKLVSYNMRWRGGDELRAITKLLRDDKELGGADVIGLQEVDRGRRRSGSVDAARQMAEELGLNFAWAAAPNDGTRRGDREAGEDETGVAILSPHPLSDIVRLVLPHAGPDCQRRAAVGATVRIGDGYVRVYSVHAETRLPVARKIEQWRAVLDDLRARPSVTRAVVLGDFNTIKPKDVSAARKLFSEAGFSTPFDDEEPTWRTFLVELKLDWLWLRGLQAVGHGIARGVTYSDHYPLWVKTKLMNTER